jgi:acyl-CoA thioesterase FadM
MTHTTRFTVATDTSQFTWLQLQPRTLLSLAWNGYARWLREHLCSFPHLIGKEGIGTVVLAIDLAYREPLRFLDGDALDVEVALRPRRGGSRLELRVTVEGGGRQAADIGILLCPVEIVEQEALTAVPTTLPARLAGRFPPGADDATAPPRALPGLLAEIESQGHLLASREGTFSVHHQYCEVAEQWSFIEVPGLIEAVREALALDDHGRLPVLRRSLREPLQRIHVELSHPYFVHEAGRIQTAVYDWRERPVFVHRLLSGTIAGQVHGIAIERY